MSVKKTVVRAGLVVVGVPIALVLIAGARIAAQNRNNREITWGGGKREYLLHVPPGYGRARPAPLVISLHGAATWPAQQMNLSRWNTLADANGFIVVYPSGTGAGPRIWHNEDTAFIANLIDTLEAAYNIDRTRIYANGFSQGGGMTYELSCALSDRIAAVGMVGAAMFGPWNECSGHRPMPVIAFHGTADPLALYDGGKSWVAPRPLLGVKMWVADWARRNRCRTEPVDSVISAAVTRREYRDCSDSAAVVLYTLHGAGHQWPGGKPMPRWWVGPASNAVDATSLMWAFFRERRLQEE